MNQKFLSASDRIKYSIKASLVGGVVPFAKAPGMDELSMKAGDNNWMSGTGKLAAT